VRPGCPTPESSGYDAGVRERGRSLLLVTLLAVACGGRSEGHGVRPSTARDCSGPIVLDDPQLDAAVRSAGTFAADHAITSEEALGIKSLYVQGPTSLAGLECFPNVRSLTAREGPLTDIEPLAYLKDLEWIDLSGNAITDLSPLDGHDKLRWIDLTRNAIEDLSPLASNPIINDLHFDFNRVATLEPLSGIPIAILLGTNNRITDLSPLATMGTYLREAALSYNPIRELPPLAENSQLEVLRLDATEITDLSQLARKGILRILSVDRSGVRDLSPLSAFPSLHLVRARGNQVESLEGLTLPEPRCGGALELVDNPLDASDVEATCATGWVVRYGDSLMPEQCNLDCLQ
jgi:Leucine-rich repeat (LRR) protein